MAVALDFSHDGHALVTFYVQFLCSDWSKFDRWVEKIYAASGNLFTDSCVILWCFYTVINCRFPLVFFQWNTSASKILLIFMAGLFRVFCNLRSDVIIIIIIFWLLSFFGSRGKKIHKGIIGRGHDLRLGILLRIAPLVKVIRNPISDAIVFHFHLAWCVRRLKSLKRFLPYLMAFRSCIFTGKP